MRELKLLFLFLIPFVCFPSSVSALDVNIKFPFDWKLPWDRHYFKPGEKIDLLVNTVESENTQIPYAYYNLPFICPPTDEAKPVHLSAAEILNGDRFWQSDYHLEFETDEPCKRICDRGIKKLAIGKAIELIKQDYMVEWIIDGIPGATTLVKTNIDDAPKKYYIAGFPLGFIENDVSYLHNHVMMVIRWHKESNDPNKKTIVGFEVYPKSVSDFHCPGASKNFKNFVLDPNKDELLIPFTYSVYWREDPEIDYNSRWKMYITPGATANDGKMHWIAIINSLVLISLLTIIVAVVLLRTLKTDMSNNNDNSDNKKGPVIGWRSISHEVFIQPILPKTLCMLAGSGVQLIFTILGIAILLLSGMSGPNTTILSAILSLFVVAGFFAGFGSVQFYKLFSANTKASESLKISIMSGSLLITVCLIITIITNSIIYDKESPRSIQFSTILLLFVGYICFEIPISVFGGIVSQKINFITRFIKNKIPNTEIVNHQDIRKNIPKQPLYNSFFVSLFLFGAFPFGIIFVEMLFLYKALWVDKLSSMYMYGFISLTAILLFVVISEISVISTYLRLSSGDYINWQWKSFITCSCSILIYLMSYTVYYLLFKMKIVDLASPILYLIYSTMLNLLISVACGSFGLFSSTLFVYTIYSSIKKD